MGKIVVFDSGFGSLSIIKSIQKHTKSDIIYFADQKNYPYGMKSPKKLEAIIKSNISYLREKFNPDLIVVGSNTPSLLFRKLFEDDDTLIGVLPPIQIAQTITKTNSIAILVTKSISQSLELNNYIKNNMSNQIKTTIINASPLVDLVESGKFIHDVKLCNDKIISVLKQEFIANDIDVATLSSTHLPFLLSYMQQLFPSVIFLDPADDVAKQITSHKSFFPSPKNTLKIFSSANSIRFQKNLELIGIKEIVHDLDLD